MSYFRLLCGKGFLHRLFHFYFRYKSLHCINISDWAARMWSIWKKKCEIIKCLFTIIFKQMKFKSIFLKLFNLLKFLWQSLWKVIPDDRWSFLNFQFASLFSFGTYLLCQRNLFFKESLSKVFVLPIPRVSVSMKYSFMHNTLRAIFCYSLLFE